MKGKFLCNILISAIFCVQYATCLSGSLAAEASGKTLSINCGSGKAIFVTEASYGKNCNSALLNNEKYNLVQACNDKTSCNYRVDHTNPSVGDPAVGCPKTYVYQYECAQMDVQIKSGSLSAEASGKTLSINCNTGRVNILSASYGRNCNSALYNNENVNLAASCNGSPSCNYRVDHTIIGDPAVNCPKTYEYEYQCVAATKGSLSAEATGKTLTIDCNGNGAIDIVSASYGQNCNSALFNNQEDNLEAACDGKGSCSYRVDHRIIGDPAVGCAKTYVYEYYCVSGMTGEGVGVFPYSFNTIYTINVSESTIQMVCALIGLLVILLIVLIFQLSCKKSKSVKGYVPVKYVDNELTV